MVIRTWSLKAHRSSLDDTDAVLMLRLGAAANALQSTQRWFLAVKNAKGPAGSRDRLASFLVAAAYLKEAIDGLVRPNFARIKKLASDAGAPPALLQKLGKVMSKKKRSLYADLLMHTRNKLVFHWEDNPFRGWARRYPNSEVMWGKGTGATRGEAVHWASSDAVVASVMPGATASQVAEKLRQVAEASNLVIEVIEFATESFLRRHAGTIHNGDP